MKRVLSVLTALCLLVAFLPVGVLHFPVAAETYGDLTYSVSGGKVTITDCADSATGELVIPATIGEYPVTTIGMSAFEGCTGLTAITVGENVTTIGTYAFENCTGLTAITIGAKVTSVGSAVFAGCTGLTGISVAQGNPVYCSAGNCLIETSSKTLVAGCKASQIPADDTVTSIGNLAFFNCGELTGITIPDNIKSIGISAFDGCTKLAAVTLGTGVTDVGNRAFYGCTALTEAVIPDNVTTLGSFVFSGCTGLTVVTVGNGVSAISDQAFSGCTKLETVTLGTNVATIGIFAFSGCSALTKAALPEGVTTIGEFAFYNCEKLATVEIPASVNQIGDNAFSGCAELRLFISEGNTYATSYAEDNSIAYTTSLSITTVVLRPSVAGVYFSSNLAWAADDTGIEAYGIAVSLENPLPVADDSDASCRYTQGYTSVLIENILVGDTVTEKQANAKTAIYARAYTKKTDGTYVYGNAVQVSLKQVVIAAQSNWEALTGVQKEAMVDMYTTYSDVMTSWKIPNLKDAATSA